MASQRTIALYPDLAAVGGLAAALRSMLQAMKSPLGVTELPKEHRIFAYARGTWRPSITDLHWRERLLNDFGEWVN